MIKSLKEFILDKVFVPANGDESWFGRERYPFIFFFGLFMIMLALFVFSAIMWRKFGFVDNVIGFALSVDFVMKTALCYIVSLLIYSLKVNSKKLSIIFFGSFFMLPIAYSIIKMFPLSGPQAVGIASFVYVVFIFTQIIYFISFLRYIRRAGRYDKVVAGLFVIFWLFVLVRSYI